MKRFGYKNVWLTAFILFSFILFERAVKKVHEEYDHFYVKKETLEESIKEAEKIQIRLNEEIMSESDPAWIELTLMRVLGLIPEGTKKVYFND